MADTGTQILDDALGSIGILEPGDTIGASGSSEAQSYATEALRKMNSIIRMDNAENLMIPARTRKLITTSSQSYEYTMTERPIHVEGISYKTDNGGDIWLRRMDIQYFESIVVKTVVSWPTRFLYEPTFNVGTMFFDRTVASGKQFTMVYLAPLTELAAITDTIDTPNEYIPYLEAETAILLAGRFNLAVPAGVARKAKRARDIIKRRAGRLRIRLSQVDAGVPTSKMRRPNIEIDV